MISAVLDHLWQSTLAALAVAILAVAFRKASAGVRYGLWFAASLKFLIPFAALATVGRLLAPAGLFPAHAAPEAAIIEQAARPLARFPFAHDAALLAPLSPSASPAAPQAHTLASVAHVDLGLILLGVWAMGSAAILVTWGIRWARVHKIVGAAAPLAWPAPMPVLASRSLMEPGLIGFLRPVLVVPETLPERLTQSEIAAILAHEIGHLRRRDNLTAAIHMLVEALFWFHPLVWWIGARLIEERELACDEAVVQAGHDRAAYARSLVESCRLYLQSPLSCVAGASGSNLKTRVEAIMTAPPTSPLSPLKQALLLAAGACAVATPVAAGLLTPAGQRAAVQAARLTASVLGAPAAAPASDPATSDKPTVLARNEAVLAPALALSRFDIPTTPLSRDIPAPPAVAPAAPQPVQLARAAPPSTRLSPEATASALVPQSAPLPADPVEIRRQVADFVGAYGAFTGGPFGRSHLTGRWGSPLCIQIVGLTDEQEAAIRARIAQVAKEVDLAVQPDDCARHNLEIVFSNDPQGMIDGLAKREPQILGDRTSDSRNVKAITQPIQAWYRTNGSTFAENNMGGLKALVVYPSMQPGSVGPDGYAFDPGSIGQPTGAGVCCGSFPGGFQGDGGMSGDRLFINVLAIVDTRRPEIRTKSLGRIADYLAMVGLSQPRDLGKCNALPSVADLFAACPDRVPPDGLTAADAAYLTALYPQKGRGRLAGDEASIVSRMTKIMVNDKMASR